MATDRKGKARKITESAVLDMARLIGTYNMTETEAALNIGIRPTQWFNFKNRAANSKKFSDILAHARSLTIEACISGIEKAGERDWRALDRRLQYVDRDRYSPQNRPEVQVQVNVMNEGDIAKALALAYGDKKPALVVDSKPVKQISDAKTTQPVQGVDAQ